MNTLDTSNSSPLQAIEFANLRSHVLRALRESIILGHLPQGDAVVETRLASQLKVSRGTVREAMLELQQEQLLEPGPNGRLRVPLMDSDTVKKLFSVRASLEGLAAREIAVSPARASKQATLSERLEALEAARGGSMIDLVDADLAFHRTLCELSENEVLVRTWRTLEGPLRLAIMHAGAEQAALNISPEQHEPFIQALEADAADPEGTIREAIERTANTLTAFNQEDS